MRAPVRVLLNAIPDVVDARMLALALLEGNVNINDITLTTCTCYEKRLSLCFRAQFASCVALLF